jgi:hypothetical protein
MRKFVQLWGAHSFAPDPAEEDNSMQQTRQRRNCSNCYFSRQLAGRLHCVINPPAVQAATGEARWPAVKDDDTCGAFRYADHNPAEKDHWPKNALPIYRDRFGDYCKIPLTQGKFAKVDPEDYIWLSQFKWYCNNRPHTSYAIRNAGEGKERRKVLMHREIMDTPGHLVCDHINRHGLDNRKKNLRNCTKGENNLNQGGERNSASKYKGVYWKKDTKKWAACIKKGGKRKHLGYFDDEAEAAKAYDDAARRLHGQFAGLNFPQIQNTND